MTVPAARLLSDLLPGDRILAIDGHDLRQPREVEAVPVGTFYGGPDGVRIVNALGTSTEWMLYPGNVEQVTIERDVAVIETRAREHIARTLDADGDLIPRNHREAFGYAWKKTLDRMDAREQSR